MSTTPQLFNVAKVRITVFDKAVLSRNIFGSARVSWKTDTSGSIVKRNVKGRFCSIPFVIV